MTATWESAQTAEMAFWGSCANTYEEERLQMIEADRMLLDIRRSVIHTSGTIVDIGGGPVSLLLKSVGWDRAIVVDPAPYPSWTRDRYAAAGVHVIDVTGEHFVEHDDTDPIDEIWLYNVLQHVHDPETVVVGACRRARMVRVFEWVGFERNDAHIHVLDGDAIHRWGASVPGTWAMARTETIEFNGSDNPSFQGVFVRGAE